jgi:thiol-disulfide isomerase/thioredoxin
MLLKDMRSAYLIDDTSLMPYMEANGLGGNEVYRWMAGLKKAQELASRISALQPVTDNAEWDSIMPYYRPTLKQMNDTTLSILARQKASQKSDVHICETTALTSADILSEIVSKYPGKVVLVDCWATWCVPCRRGIEAMKPMEKELEGKDFVPVFLTDGSSPIKTWVEMTNTMPGEHYRLTNEQWKKLPSMNGIPRYWLFGKDGKKLMDQTGWGDELLETFRTNINKALQ